MVTPNANELTLEEMDALLLAVEREEFTPDQQKLFMAGMDKIRKAWVAAARTKPGYMDDSVLVKMMNRDPDSPFNSMIDMTGASP